MHFCEFVKGERRSVVGTVLPGNADRFRFLGIWVRVDIYRFGSADLDLHMSCGMEILAGPNRFESPLLLGEEDSINCAAS
jgi:hypothetical protein